MNKAFVREADGEDDDEDDVPSPAPLPPGLKNYITAPGYQRLRDELLALIDGERPEVVRTVTWAASNGDRSENADYIYGKRRLREIDRRIRFLTKRLDTAEVVDPSRQENRDRVFFGATVHLLRNDEHEETITIVGIDEVDAARGMVSWISPIARALLKARIGDRVTLRTPGGVDEIDILAVDYPERSSG